MSAGAYSAPRPLAGFKGREMGNGEGMGKGEVRGIAPWLLGDRRP